MKLTREQKRNIKANLIAREVRHQVVLYGGIADNQKLFKLVADWLKYGVKESYIPVKNKKF